MSAHENFRITEANVGDVWNRWQPNSKHMVNFERNRLLRVYAHEKFMAIFDRLCAVDDYHFHALFKVKCYGAKITFMLRRSNVGKCYIHLVFDISRTDDVDDMFNKMMAAWKRLDKGK